MRPSLLVVDIGSRVLFGFNRENIFLQLGLLNRKQMLGISFFSRFMPKVNTCKKKIFLYLSNLSGNLILSRYNLIYIFIKNAALFVASLDILKKGCQGEGNPRDRVFVISLRCIFMIYQVVHHYHTPQYPYTALTDSPFVHTYHHNR